MKITSLEQYIEQLRNLSASWDLTETTNHAWYRGQGNEAGQAPGAPLTKP